MLVDAGFGIRSLRRRCSEAGIELGDLDAILVTHGHCDHVSGIPGLVRNCRPVVFLNQGTREEVRELRCLDRCEVFESGSGFTVGDMSVQSFRVPHDAAETVGFRIEANGITGLVATDLGELTPTVIDNTQRLNWLVMESNHDEELLKMGPYPWALKRRVLGSEGHLSNRALGEFLTHVYDGGADHLFLAHLSRQNNDPELALATAVAAVEHRHPLASGRDLAVHLTHQGKASILIDL